jgi:hypothetical protein
MGRLVRGAVRIFGIFFVASMLFGMGSAVVAAFAKRRVETTEDPASNEPTAASIYAGEQFVSSAPALRAARVITWFAGHDVDLRGATLDPSGASLDLRTMYGGTQVVVPEGWRVRSSVLSIFGGTQVDIEDDRLPEDAPLLELRGFTLFGGVRVTTSPDASWSGADHEGEALPPAATAATAAEALINATNMLTDTATEAAEAATGDAIPAEGSSPA